MPRGLPAFALLVMTLLPLGCAASAPRVYYAPVGADFGETIGEWSLENERESFMVRCQGSYLNEVRGHSLRTVHMQLVATRTTGETMALPLEAMILDVLRDDGTVSEPLGVSEAWQGPAPIHDALIVPPWSRRAADLFFDDPTLITSAPGLLRLRFSQPGPGGTPQLYECQFFPLTADDPRRPGEEALHDPGYGYRDGYYFPGWGDLGERKLRSAGEVRLFHLFHDPDAGLFW